MIVCDYDELVKALREHAEWMGPNNYELPISMYDDLLKAADAIEELSKPKWISVEERLPEKYHQVLVYGRNGLQIDYYAGAKSVCGNPLFMISEAKATHWMPLPEPPKEERQ